MTGKQRNSDTRARRLTWAAAVGALLIVAAVLLSPGAVERLLEPYSWRPARIPTSGLLALRVILALAGLALLLGRTGPLGRRAGAALAIVGLSAAGAGAYGSAIARGLLPRPAPSLETLCRLAERGQFPPYSDQMIVETRARLRSLPDGTSERVHRLRLSLFDLYLSTGRFEEARTQLDSAASIPGLETDLQLDRLRRFGLLHLRIDQVRNCREAPERCVFPFAPGSEWTATEDAERAIGYFREYLAQRPGDPGIRWLLVVARSATGETPADLPAWAILEGDGAPNDAPGRFRDIAMSLGVADLDNVGGAVIDDIDDDGYLDIVTSTIDHCSPLRLYRNGGDGTFTDVAESAGLGDQLGGFSVSQGDFDNDGRLDLLVVRGAWMGPELGRLPNSLLRQNDDGTFTDVTEEAGLGGAAYPVLAAGWADYDLDGHIDLFVGNERFPSQLFRNRGDGTFVEVSDRAGIANLGVVRAVAWGDYDGDRYPDLYVSNLGSRNRLFRNEGDGTFTDVAADLGVDQHEPSQDTFGAWFWDYDNDGHLDLFVAGFPRVPMAVQAADYLGVETSEERMRLYRNDANGGFVDVTERAGLGLIRKSMGYNYEDVDGDGYLDFYLGTGAPPFDYVIPNAMFGGVGGERFEEWTSPLGLGHLGKGHAVAFGDLDNDGDPDIYHQIGGALEDDQYHNALFENPGGDHHWISLELEGVESNRDAIGTRIAIELDPVDGPPGAIAGMPADERSAVRAGGAYPSRIFRWVGTGGTFGGNSLRQEIGLGDAERIRSLEIFWPKTGETQRFENVPVDGFLRIVEGASDYEALERRRVRFEPRP